ncbi:hypothetical protein ACHHYP_18018 [Achlya hypogyna]|uniref:EF-hand domain-containing protein n=1 Tax=Achlya hypogyna TaxID=1202772 RepID=A0A1V9ZMY1_ACHHY|nr:hypothetical protein ACHHYP_18018 [Achlya hypogyna]
MNELSVNRNAVAKLREQNKLIERLKHDKATLEERLYHLQQDLQLHQQVRVTLIITADTAFEVEHSLLVAKRSADAVEYNLPIIDPTRNNFPTTLREAFDLDKEEGPDRIGLTPTEQREIQGLRLKVHNLEAEKKKRAEEFAAQSKMYLRKIQKLEQELAQHEASLRERDMTIRMLEIRALHHGHDSRAKVGTTRMLDDAIWSGVVPLRCQVEPHFENADIGAAYEALLSNQVFDSLKKLPGHYTEQWLHEVKVSSFDSLIGVTAVKDTASKLAYVHTGFKALSGSFQRVASCTDLYELVALISAEALALVDAEEAFVFVVDPFQKNEFWCRVRRPDGETVTSRFAIAPVPISLQTSYNEYLTQQPASHANNTPPSSVPAVVLPRALLHTAPGFAPYVYHTRETLNIPGCKIVSHPLYSGDSTSTDRLIKLKSSATLLLPICSGDSREPIAVLQVCGKTQKFRGMGLEVAVENCQPFTTEDQLLLSGLANFCGGLLKKVMSFTELETNRRSEYVLLSLSRQIFTCLDFKKLSMLVMKSTKELLDTEHVLSAWQSDMGTGSIDFHKGTEILVRFGEGIAGACAELRTLINAYDEKTKYRTKSILAAPIMSSKTTLLGVIQMINKSGGTPFRTKDEEHLVVVAQLIALAMENSNLFQKTQDVSKCIGTYIRHLHLNEALLNLSSAAEDIVGVQGAAIYLVDERTNELFTFHKTRKTRVDVRSASYKNSIMEEAMTKRETIIVNSTGMCLYYNPAVDTVGGVAAQQVMYVPLFHYGKNQLKDKTFFGLLHLINRKGTVHDFEYEDSLVAIVVNQVAGILTSIMERQLLLETCMSFYKELNPLGVMNAVYNASIATFSIDRGHLWLFNEDKTAMWTPKILPPEELKFVNPSLQRRVSVSTRDILEVPFAEGLLKRVVQEGKMICVRRWDLVGDATQVDGVQRITMTDRVAGFTEFAITAAPVWDSFGIEVLGVLMLVYPRGRSLHRLELSKIPIFTRQITGALVVCREVSRHLHQLRRMESLLRGYTPGDLQAPNLVSAPSGSPAHEAAHVFSLAVEIDAHGWLKTQSYPINLFSKGCLLKNRMELMRLPMDVMGNRHVIQVTTCPRAVFAKEHFDKWIGHEIPFGDWEKIKYDVHNAFSRKETLTAYYSSGRSGQRTTLKLETSSIDDPLTDDRPLWDLSDHIRQEVASFLWLFCNYDLRIEWGQVFALFTAYDVDNSGKVDPQDLERVLKACGVRLNHHEYDALGKMFSVFAKPEKGMPVDTDGAYQVLELFQALAPYFIKHIHFDHEIFPNLNPTTHVVASVQLLLSPTGLDCVKIPTL